MLDGFIHSFSKTKKLLNNHVVIRITVHPSGAHLLVLSPKRPLKRCRAEGEHLRGVERVFVADSWEAPERSWRGRLGVHLAQQELQATGLIHCEQTT